MRSHLGRLSIRPIKERPLPSFLRRLRYGKPIVIVSGLPRSGTSMTMKMLDAAKLDMIQDGIRTADVDNPKGYFELERVKDLDKGGDNSWVRDMRGSAVKIISFLLEYLPPENNYQVLFMNRELNEVLKSQAKMLEHRSEESHTEDERMRDLYQKHLIRVRSMLRARPSFEFVELSHREAIEDPRRQAEQIQQFLGLPASAVDAMAGVVDQKLYRNRA